MASSPFKGLISALIVFCIILGSGLLFFYPELPTDPKEIEALHKAEMMAEENAVQHQEWTFAGMMGHFDDAQLQRGYKVYREVCASCHGLKLLKYRNLAEAGGPGFTEGQVQTLAAEAQVDIIDDDGNPANRPGLPSDGFRSPFANDKAARAANGGALPPDLSVIAKARNVHSETPWYLAPVQYLKDIVTGQQEGGADYLHGLLTGYKDAPADFAVSEGLYYNTAFPGYQIAMPAPMSDGQVEYTDGSPATVDQYSRDVAAFLMWTSEPHLETRKQLGLRVLFYLLIMAVIFWLAKRALWSRLH